MVVVSIGQIGLTDVNDAIVSGSAPLNPSSGTLWVDTSVTPNLLKEWTGVWTVRGEISTQGTGTTVTNINTTLGNMTNDNIIDFNERQYVKDRITEIIGYVQTDATITLPTTATLDSGGRGSFYNARKSALNAGISSLDTGIASGTTTYGQTYDALVTKYNALKTYLEGLTPIDVWDVSSSNKDVNVSVTKSTWRTNWTDYYQAELDLEVATAKKLRENVDNVTIGGTNWASNGDFAFDITSSLWKDSYIGQTKEVVDISTETPPHKYAYHVKNTTNANGGIFSPILWDGTIAEKMVDKEITISFWIKYQNIIQGAQSYNLGRFGELIIEGETSGGSKVYRYPRIVSTGVTEVAYISGTNTTWQKYSGTIKLSLPPTAIKLTRIQFKHGIENCTGEFWTTGIMVEVGNKASDWSICPLDLQQKFTNIEFGVQGDQIVSKITSEQSYITHLNQHTDSKINATIWGVRNYVLNSSFERELRHWYPINFYVDDNHELSDTTSFEDSDDIDVFLDNLFGEDSADFESSVQQEEVELKKWVRISGSPTSIYSGIYQNVRLENGKSYIVSFKAFNDTGSLDVYIGDIFLGNVVLNRKWDLYYFKFTATSTGDFSLKFKGNSPSTYKIYITDIKLEEGNVKPTDWSPSPEDMYEEAKAIDLLTTRVNTVEQIVTDESIVSTVTSSDTYKSMVSGKVDNLTLTTNYPSKEDMNTAIGGIDVKGGVDTRLGELMSDPDSSLSKTFVTQSQMKQTSKDITSKFSATGGMNLIRNSIGFADLITQSDAQTGIRNWFPIGTTSRVTRVPNNTALETLGFGSGFQFANDTTTSNDVSLRQYVPVVPNQPYTMSWYVEKRNSSPAGNDNGAFSIFIYEGDTTNKITLTVTDKAGVQSTTSTYKYASETMTNGYETQYVTFTPTTSKVQVVLYANGLCSATITGLMFSIGDVALQWSLATGETFNTNVRLDINGIRVSQLDSSKNEIGYTQITPSEFAGYFKVGSNFEKIFYLNGEETVTKKFRATEEITMGNLKIIRMEEGGYSGWAFVSNK